MIKLFPGGVGRVVVRGPARVRGVSAEPFGLGFDVFPFPNPTSARLIWVVNSGQVRAYFYSGWQPSDYYFNLVDRLSHGTFFPGLRGGWLFNEQVAPRLSNVTLL